MNAHPSVIITGARVLTVPVNHRGDWLFVALETSDGHTGWGESSHSRDDAAAARELTGLADALVGTRVEPRAEAARLVEIAPEDFVRRTAWSGVAQALLDLAGRVAGTGVATLLSGGAGTPSTLPLYANVNRMLAERSPDAFAAAGAKVRAAGFSRAKCAPFDEVSPEALYRDGPAILAPGAARLQALRQALGPDVALMIDCHWRFTEAALDALAGIARDVGAFWVEDVLPKEDATLLGRLRDRSGARIAGGEAMISTPAFQALADSGAVDVLIADVKHVGGTEALHRIAAIADARGLAFAPHTPSGPISTAASAHACAAAPNTLFVEFPFGETDWRPAFAEGESVEADRIALSAPGYGVALHPDRAGPPIR